MNTLDCTVPALDWLPVFCRGTVAHARSSAEISRFVARAARELQSLGDEARRASAQWEAMAERTRPERRAMLEACIRLRAEEMRMYAASLELLDEFTRSQRGVEAELALLAADNAARARQAWLLEMKKLTRTAQPCCGAA